MKVRKWIFVEIFSLRILPQHLVNIPDRRQTEYFKSCDTKACLWIYTGVCVNICILLVFVFLHCFAPSPCVLKPCQSLEIVTGTNSY